MIGNKGDHKSKAKAKRKKNLTFSLMEENQAVLCRIDARSTGEQCSFQSSNKQGDWLAGRMSIDNDHDHVDICVISTELGRSVGKIVAGIEQFFLIRFCRLSAVFGQKSQSTIHILSPL